MGSFQARKPVFGKEGGEAVLSQQAGLTPSLSLGSRAVNSRFIPSNGSIFSTDSLFCPVGLALAGTITGLSSVAMNVTSPPPCTPSLHRNYPASSLLWVL